MVVDVSLINQRSFRVAQMLRLALDLKMLRGSGRPNAGETLEQAFQEASQEPRLPWPEPELCAYRLAQWSMRTARTVDQLRFVEELLAFATQKPSGTEHGESELGVLPLCVRLAVLKRLEDLGEGSRRDEIEQLFERAVEITRHRSLAGHEGTARQSEDLNLLELTSYVLGMDYTSLEGRGFELGRVHDPQGWTLIGSHGLTPTVRYTLEAAEAALRDRLARGYADFGFRVGERTNKKGSILTVRGDRLARMMASNNIDLLPGLCLGLPSQSYPSFDSNNLSRDMDRLGDKLAEIIPGELFQSAGGPIVRNHDDDGYGLADGLRVVGLVPISRLEALAPGHRVAG